MKRKTTVAAAGVVAIATTAGAWIGQETWGDHRPVVSPDGETLVFMSNRSGTWSVYLMPLEGPPRPVRVSDDPRGEWYPDWSPDGSKLVYHRHDPDTGTSFLRLYDVSTGREEPLGAIDGNRRYARWAPDGRSLIYNCESGVCAMTPNGRELGTVYGLDADQYEPAPSPDGSRVAFVQQLEGDLEEAILMRTDGTERTRLTHDDGRTYGLDWSRDGRWLAYNTTVDGNSDIYLYDTRSGTHTRLTSHEASEHLPRWSADGTYLVFTSERSGAERIYRIAPDGSDLRRIPTGGD